MAGSEPSGGRFSPEESPDRRALEELQLRKLEALLERILPANSFYARKLAAAGFPRRGSGGLASLADLRLLPFTTKEELQADQEAHPPYGTNLSFPLERYLRLHQTSGTRGRPLRWLDTEESWEWVLRCWGAIYRAAGVGAGERVFVPFSFGPFLGFWAGFEAALRRGLMALPGGGMGSAQRLRFLIEHRATALLATPTYALRLLDVAREEAVDPSSGSLRSVFVAGEPGGCVPEVRRRIEEGFGARVFDHWGMTEVGPLGFEAVEDPGHLLLLESECIAEVLDPTTLEPVGPGARGELCITTLGRAGSPLIRYRTGDLVSCARGPSPSGRSFLRLAGGILGRLDDMILVKGNNVYPSAVEAVVRRFPEAVEYQVVVEMRGGAASALRLRVEPRAGAGGPGLAEALRGAFQEAFSFRPEVELVPPGTLPRFE
ncbi:MAG: phenylacetate--CoA ligase family protein, partial [Thermoanaerobaculia bacterium]